MKSLIVVMCLFLGWGAMGSTSKVGNGDEGRDLERLTPITSGKIFDSQKIAIQRLKRLNVQGMPGLGALIPELENTKLLMSSVNVRPIAGEGPWEINDESKQVYARTFAEPYSPTRFFPVAKSLNEDQLVALHTHEALHRALPPGIRENEDKVAMLTLALTSPAATFDRVNRTVNSLLMLDIEREDKKAEVYSFYGSSKKQTDGRRTSSANISSLPSNLMGNKTKKRPVTISYQISAMDGAGDLYSSEGYYRNWQSPRVVQDVGIGFSPMGVLQIVGQDVEPRVELRGFLLDSFSNQYYLGPLSGKLRGAMKSKSYHFGPQFRFSTSATADEFPSYLAAQRDVSALGFYSEGGEGRNYSKFEVNYVFGEPRRTVRTDVERRVISDGVPGAWSGRLSYGFKLSRFSFGLQGRLNYLEAGRRSESVTLARLGPELGWSYKNFQLALTGLFALNRPRFVTADTFRDLVGEGMGTDQVSLRFGVDI